MADRHLGKLAHAEYGAIHAERTQHEAGHAELGFAGLAIPHEETAQHGVAAVAARDGNRIVLINGETEHVAIAGVEARETPTVAVDVMNESGRYFLVPYAAVLRPGDGVDGGGAIATHH